MDPAIFDCWADRANELEAPVQVWFESEYQDFTTVEMFFPDEVGSYKSQGNCFLSRKDMTRLRDWLNKALETK